MVGINQGETKLHVIADHGSAYNMTHDTSGSLVTVARYDTVGDAQLAKTQLESAGIPCMIANEDQSGLSTMFDTTEGGVKIKVNETDRDKAQEILEQDSDA